METEKNIYESFVTNIIEGIFKKIKVDIDKMDYEERIKIFDIILNKVKVLNAINNESIWYDLTRNY